MKKEREICKGDIYWSNQPYVKGHIQKNSRPYLVVSAKNNKGYVTILPITGKIKKIANRDNIIVRGKVNQVICDQPQTVLISTLGRYLDRIDNVDVDECLRVMLKFFCYDFSNEDEEFWARQYFDISNLDN